MPVPSKVKKLRSPELFQLEAGLLAPEHAALKSGVFRIAGVDEAGRGPLAGPVVAAAVMFPTDRLKGEPDELIPGINDSKTLSAKTRQILFKEIKKFPDIMIGVGICTPREIDRLNILKATHLAMKRAIEELTELPQLAFIDGLPVSGLPVDSRSIVKGDRKCFSIAAASIIAKETRDYLMREMDKKYPVYGFAAHKGYGTQKHLLALKKHGPCEIHRQSFAPVRDYSYK